MQLVEGLMENKIMKQGHTTPSPPMGLCQQHVLTELSAAHVIAKDFNMFPTSLTSP